MQQAVAGIAWDGRSNREPCDKTAATGSRWVQGRGMSLSLRHGSQGGGRAYAMATMDVRGVVTIQHNAPEIGQGTHNLFSVIAARTLVCRKARSVLERPTRRLIYPSLASARNAPRCKWVMPCIMPAKS